MLPPAGQWGLLLEIDLDQSGATAVHDIPFAPMPSWYVTLNHPDAPCPRRPYPWVVIT